MTSKEFDQVLARYLNGAAEKNEKELVEKWFDKINVDEADDLTNKQIFKLREKVWTRINHFSSANSSGKWDLSLLKIAASVFFLLASSVLPLKEDFNKSNSMLISDDLAAFVKF